jgi:hypothetical protein
MVDDGPPLRVKRAVRVRWMLQMVAEDLLGEGESWILVMDGRNEVGAVKAAEGFAVEWEVAART